jgi:hypothetical protein
MPRRYWRARYDLDYFGVYHEPPPPQPEEVHAIGEARQIYPFRYLSNNAGGTRKSADLPYSYGGGVLMNLRAAEVLLPLLAPWASIQSDVRVDGGPTHVLAIVNHVYDAMNEVHSIGTQGTKSGIWLSVKDLHLFDNNIGPSPIFRLPSRGLQWDHVVGEEIFEAIHAHKLTGMALEEAVMTGAIRSK